MLRRSLVGIYCLAFFIHGSAQAAFVLDHDITSVSTTTYSGSIFGGLGTKAFDDALWDGGAGEEEAWRVDGTGSAYIQQNFPENHTITRLAANALNAHGIEAGSGLRDFNVLAGDTEASLAVVATFQYQNADNTWQIFDLPATQPAKVWRIQPFGGTWRSDDHIYLTEIEMESTTPPPPPTPTPVVTYRTVVLRNDEAPGMGPGVFFSHFDAPAIRNNGQVILNSYLTGPGINSSNGGTIWIEDNGSFTLLVQEDQQAPDTTEGVRFTNLIHPHVNPYVDSNGQVSFRAFLTGTDVDHTNDRGIWSASSGSLTKIAREGDAAPGTTGGVLYHSIWPPLSNDSGQIAYEATLTGTGVDSTNDNGIWSNVGGTLHMVARTGDPAPDTAPNMVFEQVWSAVFNNDGQTAFSGIAKGPNYAEKRGIWMENGGTVSLIVGGGDNAPGTEPGVTFREGIGFSPFLNDAGQVAFKGTITGSGVDDSNNEGLWFGHSGALNLIVREGDPAPGLGPDYHFGPFDGYLAFNDTGQSAFWSYITGPGIDATNYLGLWSGLPGSLKLIARTGDQAPGTEPDVLFRKLTVSGNLENPVINNLGQVAFMGQLTGDGVDANNDLGIWATDLDGNLLLIAREGDLFDINDDPLIEDLHIISSISLSAGLGDSDSLATSFSDNGEFVFSLTFEGGARGVFTAMIGTAPIIPGDLDADGFVGIDDLNLVLANWNQNVPPANPLADPSGDGFVGIDDLNAVLGNWNAGTPPSEVHTPEPAGLCLFLVGGGCLMRRRQSPI